MRRGHLKYYQFLEEIADIHEKKNGDYATVEDPLSNLRQCERLGVTSYIGTLIRMTDKFSRLEQLINKEPDVVGESVSDTLNDIANYALLARILWEEKK